MQITRRYTVEGKDPFGAFTFVPRDLAHRQPGREGGVRDEGPARPRALVAGGRGHPGPEVLPPGRRARARTERVPEEGVPEWLQRSVPAAGDPRTGQETDARQVFRRLAGCWAYWGWKGGYFSSRGRRRGLLRRDVPHAGGADGGAELAAVVQHRPALGLRHRRAAAGTLLRRSARRGEVVRSTSAYEQPAPHACFIQSIKDDLVNEGGIMDLWVREARIFKYGSGTGIEFLRPARRGRAAVRRRQVERPDELPQDRRPGGRRHQVGRDHAPRRQNGRSGSRSSGHRGVRQLEGGRGGEGRVAGDRLAAAEPPSQRHPQGLPRLAQRRRTLRPRQQRRPAQGHRRRPCRPGPGQLHRAHVAAGAAGLHVAADRGIQHRLELQGVSTPSPARTATTRCASTTPS